MANRDRIGALVTLACGVALVLAAGVDARANAPRSTFQVTLSAQLNKSWNYVTERQVGDCTVSTRVKGIRTVTLRSARPTVVTVTSTGGSPRFSPALVRSVTARASQGGAVTRSERGPGCTPGAHADCVKTRRTLANQTLRFFRSRRNELSFRRTRDFGVPVSSCPSEAADVRVEQPGIHEAQGELSERDLFNRGIRVQTASGSYEETTELNGALDGKVVETVRWTLTFRHAR